jgi:hypothetical protein
LCSNSKNGKISKRILDFRFWILDWSLVTDYWSLVTGHWSLITDIHTAKAIAFA